MQSYDVVIVGGGPAGLAAALTLGRGRATALLVDGGTPRNARAHEIHNFVTRDGTPPREFRRIAREQLSPYPSIEVRDALVTRIVPLTEPDDDGLAFEVVIGDDTTPVRSRRILLATGMRDELPPIPGLVELWGDGIFQCPYCHGWELRDRPWGVVASTEQMAQFAPMFSNWGSSLTVFTHGTTFSAEITDPLRTFGFAVESEPIARLHGEKTLTSVELASGKVVPCEALIFKPPQKPVELVLALGLARDDLGFVRIDPMTKESSVKGIHVVGDTTTQQQAAIMAASEGTAAGAMLNHGIIMERVAREARRRAAAALPSSP